jgi:hypothetical protein
MPVATSAEALSAHDHGNVLEYLRKEVGVDEAMRTRMREALLRVN